MNQYTDRSDVLKKSKVLSEALKNPHIRGYVSSDGNHLDIENYKIDGNDLW